MWALSVSWGPNTGVEGWRLSTAFTRPGPLELRGASEGKSGPCFLPSPNPQLGTLDSAGSQAARALPEEGTAPWGPR